MDVNGLKTPVNLWFDKEKGRLLDFSERPWTYVWWSWGDLNPRPQTFFEQFYMCSRLIWISLFTSRSGTLCKSPATYFLDLP